MWRSSGMFRITYVDVKLFFTWEERWETWCFAATAGSESHEPSIRWWKQREKLKLLLVDENNSWLTIAEKRKPKSETFIAIKATLTQSGRVIRNRILFGALFVLLFVNRGAAILSLFAVFFLSLAFTNLATDTSIRKSSRRTKAVSQHETLQWSNI